jgi:hypothetical protein
MSAADDLAANRKAQKDLVQQHRVIGEKFNTFAAPHRRACDEKLRRDKFPPFVAIERAREKAGKAQAEVIARLRDLEAEHPKLLERLDAEHAGGTSEKVTVDVDIELDEPADSVEERGEDIPELDL